MAVGVDPRKKSIVTMVNEDGISLRYTTKQRLFVSGLKRFREVLKKEKELHKINKVEIELSHHSKKTNDERNLPAI